MLYSPSAGGILSSLSFLLVAELGLSAECGLLFRAPSLLSLRWTVFPLSAAVFADLTLYLAVGGLCLGLVELSCTLTQSPASSTSGTDSTAACLGVELFTPSYHFLTQARQLEICNIEHGDRAALRSRSACCTWRHHRGRPCFSWHLCRHCSFLSGLDPLPETLRHHTDKNFPGCPHFTWDICRVKLGKRITAAFLIVITRSSCNWASVSGSKGCFRILLVTGLIKIRSFTILLFTGETWK